MNISLAGLDIAKSVFHFVGFSSKGKEVKRRMLKRSQVSAFFANLPPCKIVMEACGSSHYWARLFSSYGHEVKLIAPQYVKPFVRGNKHDYNDACAMVQASQANNMPFVSVKTVDQQDIQLIHRYRSRLVGHRTSLSNQIRGLLAEYGIVMNRGIYQVRKQIPLILENAANGLSAEARAIFSEQYDELVQLDKAIDKQNQRLEKLIKMHPVCSRLLKARGIGPISATAMYAALGDATSFQNGRHVSAWLGLVPRQHSTGGKPFLLGISKRGNNYLRGLLIHGARSVLNHAEGKTDRLSLWALKLKERRGFNKACVALANKMARVCWVLLRREEEYRIIY